MDGVWFLPFESHEPYHYGDFVLRNDHTLWIGGSAVQERSLKTSIPFKGNLSLDRTQKSHYKGKLERPILGEKTMAFIAELWKFMRVRKKFWLLPIILVLLMLVGLIIFAEGSAVAPFVYTLF